MNKYNKGLEKNSANYVSLSPISFLLELPKSILSGLQLFTIAIRKLGQIFSKRLVA